MGDNKLSSSEIRKINKPIVEKRRRERINGCLEQIRRLMIQYSTEKPAAGFRHHKALKSSYPLSTNQLPSTPVLNKSSHPGSLQSLHVSSPAAPTSQHYQLMHNDIYVDAQTKLEKADILELAVKHLKNLQDNNRALYTQQEFPHQIQQSYLKGYNDCMDAVEKALTQTSHLNQPVIELIKNEVLKKLKASKNPINYRNSTVAEAIEKTSHPKNPNASILTSSTTPHKPLFQNKPFKDISNIMNQNNNKLLEGKESLPPFKNSAKKNFKKHYVDNNQSLKRAFKEEDKENITANFENSNNYIELSIKKAKYIENEKNVSYDDAKYLIQNIKTENQVRNTVKPHLSVTRVGDEDKEEMVWRPW